MARSVRLNPVTELIITIGPEAKETAIILGQMLNPSFSMISGTSASVGVVMSSRMYGVMIFSR